MDQATIDHEIGSCFHTGAINVVGLNIRLCESCLPSKHKEMHEREISLRKITDILRNEIAARAPRPPVTILPPGPMPGQRRKPAKPVEKQPRIKYPAPIPQNAKQRAAVNNLISLGIM